MLVVVSRLLGSGIRKQLQIGCVASFIYLSKLEF
jgi:hypothetical protein